jgi:hypothetical protein
MRYWRFAEVALPSIRKSAADERRYSQIRTKTKTGLAETFFELLSAIIRANLRQKTKNETASLVKPSEAVIMSLTIAGYYSSSSINNPRSCIS